MSYGYVYVAQVAQGANQAQLLKALLEAESYHGPSLIIAYAPCINHGIKGGMSIAQTEEKKAVDAGYWHLFRFDPRLALDGKNPFQLDSKAPTMDYEDFIMGEVRYNSLARSTLKELRNYLQRLRRMQKKSMHILLSLLKANNFKYYKWLVHFEPTIFYCYNITKQEYKKNNADKQRYFLYLINFHLSV